MALAYITDFAIPYEVKIVLLVIAGLILADLGSRFVAWLYVRIKYRKTYPYAG
ncbi:hypothetical protein [Candidatus Methanodesulfokora washburnensis]|jgi:hypothetical protein|uniref:hypothetical protein n=1 Tax=Candidatus Methanodesulfokora washburnensis TaxID=2478471 RepID=UPI0013870370|nr:hypothetical protein [Candidatus Methanodesulfokores washburnensis]